MSAREEILKLVTEWMDEELKYSARLQELAAKIRHPVLKAIFLGIAKDSEKHHHILKAMKEYLEENNPFITEEDLELIKASIRQHVDEERQSIMELSRLREKVDDPALLLLIDAMLDDEKKHHTLLFNIEREIAEKEKVDEQELWDYLWKHSPYHGTPGG